MMKKQIYLLGLALPMLGLSIWLFAALSGWGTSSSTISPVRSMPLPSSQMTLSITRYMPFSTPHLVTVTIHDAATISALYRHLLALPLLPTLPPGAVISCPMDTGLRYDMNFYHGTQLFFHARAYPTGCASVTLGQSDLRDCDMDVRMTLLNLVNAALGSPTAAYTP